MLWERYLPLAPLRGSLSAVSCALTAVVTAATISSENRCEHALPLHQVLHSASGHIFILFFYKICKDKSQDFFSYIFVKFIIYVSFKFAVSIIFFLQQRINLIGEIMEPGVFPAVLVLQPPFSTHLAENRINGVMIQKAQGLALNL